MSKRRSRGKSKNVFKKTKEGFLGHRSFMSVFGIPIAIIAVVFIVVKLVLMFAT